MIVNRTSSKNNLDRKKLGQYLPLLVLLGIHLRIPNLNESMWFDEVMYSTHIGTPTLQELWDFLLLEPPAPIYPTFLFFWYRLAGVNNDVIIRLPSLICGILSIVVAVLIAHKLYGRRAAVLAGILLCLSPVHVWYSQEATPYAMTQFFLLAALFSFLLLRENPDRPWLFIAYAFFILCAAFTHYMIVVFLLPLTLIGLTSRPWRKQIIAVHLCILFLWVAALAIKHFYGSLKTGMGFLRPFTLFEWWMLFFNWFLHGNSIWTSNPYETTMAFLLEHPLLILVQLFSFIIMIRGLMIGARKNKSIQKWELTLYLTILPLTLFCLTLIGSKKLFIERYLYSILPLFIIALAGGAASRLKKHQAALLIIPLVAVGIIAYLFFMQKPETWTVYKQNPDWRATAKFFNDEPGSSPVIYVASPAEGLEFYLNIMETTKKFHLRDYHQEFLEMDITRDKVDTIYLIKNLYWPKEFDNVLEQVSQDQRLLLKSTTTFKGTRIYTFDVRRDSS
ncbi:MAG: glycosyltransferase family 39 protein [Anaerolineales bacterium]|nr:glycosyltransferase family 39 protein [Anaerolineales bacterium]